MTQEQHASKADAMPPVSTIIRPSVHEMQFSTHNSGRAHRCDAGHDSVVQIVQRLTGNQAGGLPAAGTSE